MDSILVFPAGMTAACRYAKEMLEKAGIPTVDHPAPEVTHLLLDVPTFGTDGLLRSGGTVESLLEMLPPNVTVIGGNLVHPALEGYQTLDLLRDPGYLAANAAITADCALQVAAPLMTTTFIGSPSLVIGWGRIGKCLGQLLKAIGADVTVAARKETDRAMLRALGYRTADTAHLEDVLPKCRLILNTAPEMLLRREQLALCRNCVKIDLASQLGMEGNDVICALSLIHI